jgi:hypothetical protein
MTIQRPDRPQFFEGQYLGSADLSATIAYAREAMREHVLAGHSWGIAIGLGLIETTDGSGNTLLYIEPGFAWDGYGRPVVVLAPVQVPLGVFANLAQGQQPVWLRYHQSPYSGLRPGFQACGAEDNFSRVRESFAIEVGTRNAITDRQSGVLIGGVQVNDARLALRAVDQSAPLMCDASIPYQTYPDDSAKWLIPIGLALWQPGAPGQFQPRSPDLKKQSRLFRRYIGTVAESLYAADGVLRLRDRLTDYQTGKDVDTQCAADMMGIDDLAADQHAPGRFAGTDLVWVEGDMRAKGQVRLWGTRLELRDASGSDVSVPLYARRSVSANNLAKGQDFQIVIGDKPDGNNRLAIGTAQAYGPISELFVIRSDGKVGIGTNTPELYQGTANTTVIATPGATGVTIESGAAATGQLLFARGTIGDARQRGSLTYDHAKDALTIGTAASDRVTIDGQGHVGIGTATPDAKVTIADNGPAYLNIKANGGKNVVLLGADGSGGIVSSITNDDLQLRAGGNIPKMTIKADGKVGIGTTTPDAKITIADAGPAYLNIKANGGQNVVLLGADGSGGIVSSITNDDLQLRAGGNIPKMTIKADGKVGIGTTMPDAKVTIADAGPAYLNIKANGGQNIVLLGADGSGGIVSSITNDDLQFRAGGNSPKMTIKADGKVGIGTTTPRDPLEVNGEASKNTGAFWKNNSDERLKRNISALDGALDRLLQLRGVCFEWKEPERMGGLSGPQRGLIAQEVEKVFPEWVDTGSDGMKAVSLRGFEALIIEAFRSLKSDIDAINKRLDRLESRGSRARPE